MRKTLLAVTLAFIPFSAAAQTSNNGPILPGFPQSFQWRNNPSDWKVKDGALTICAGPRTNWYASPAEGKTWVSSPLLLLPAPKDFWLSAKLTVDFKSQWDAGALVLYADEENWVKFALENTAEKKPAIVSVVTHGLSDDVTGAMIEGNSVYLEISKSGPAVFLYFSTDGKKWQLARVFNLGPDRPWRFGFSAQSPVGEGERTTFSEIRYKPEALKFWSAE